MTISSRTPEGLPHRCPICGGEASIEPSFPGGDACCPRCGQLLWEFRDRVARALDVDPASILLSTSFADLGKDSLDIVELVMELEEEHDIAISDFDAERMTTVEDVLRYLIDRRREK